jgi:hypothetical protein
MKKLVRSGSLARVKVPTTCEQHAEKQAKAHDQREENHLLIVGKVSGKFLSFPLRRNQTEESYKTV